MPTGGYDAIISDYQMLETDGLEFLKLIRSKDDPIPFILFTGRGREEVVIEALNCGVDFYLQKGGDPRSQFKELEHKIKEAVRCNRAENALKLNESRLSKAQAIGMTGCWELNLDGRSDLVWGSEESFRIYGIPRPIDGMIELEKVGQYIDEKEFAQHAMSDLVSQGIEKDIEYHLRPANGGPMTYVRSIAELIENPQEGQQR
jgi:CheY-like chemotaxis protein